MLYFYMQKVSVGIVIANLKTWGCTNFFWGAKNLGGAKYWIL